jgi:hypothetical protein
MIGDNCRSDAEEVRSDNSDRRTSDVYQGMRGGLASTSGPHTKKAEGEVQAPARAATKETRKAPGGCGLHRLIGSITISKR